MPDVASHSLRNDERYVLTARLLHLDRLIDADDIMDADSPLRAVMPNRHPLDWAYDTQHSFCSAFYRAFGCQR